MTNKKKLKSIDMIQQANFENPSNINRFDSTSLGSSRPLPNVFFNTCFDKNHLKTVIAWFLEQYGEKMTVDLVETLKQAGFHQATRAGVSLGVDDLQIPPQKSTLLSQASVKMADVTNAIQTGNLTSVEKSQRLIDTWNQTSETLRQTAVQNFRTTNPVNPVYMMAFSGARGNISQVRQLVAMRGLMADPQGAILEFPIQSNFREGLTVTEYLISCYGARKGLVDTALRTATSGYLTRRLVDAVQHVVIHVTNCQTKKGIVIKNKNVEQRLIGRVLLEDVVLDSNTIVKKNTLISPRLAKQIATKHKEIIIRSPLTCQTEKSVCQLCYGVDLAQGKLVSIGEAVGIIAAQSIGEPGTQLTMRTFHTGGVGVFSDQAMKSFTAPFDGKIEFLESLPGLFVRTPHGNIVYLVKHKDTKQEKPILRLSPSCPLQKSMLYEINYGEVPSGSLLWVKQGELVKTGQLLLQASRLQTSTQEMPESSHPVRAPLSGEIFFQSMAIRVIEEEKRNSLKSKKKKQQNLSLAQINQKEISPTFPTLVELGNFWIFSTFVQKESQISNSFFLTGDLFSPETPIQEYNLQLPYKGRLKQLKSSLVFVHNSFDFVFSKIYYCGIFYFLVAAEQKKTQTIFAYTTNSRSTLLSWYPQTLGLQTLGYCARVPFENDFVLQKSSEIVEKTGVNQKLETSKQNFASYLWSPHQLFYLKTLPEFFNTKFLFSNSFIITGEERTLSKSGLFLVKSEQGIAWSKKNKFQLNFVKNYGKNSPDNYSHSFFLKNGLKLAQTLLHVEVEAKVIEKKQGWFYLPETAVPEFVPSQFPGVLLEPGKKFENLCFYNFYISANLIFRAQFCFLKAKTKGDRRFFANSFKEILIPTNKFKSDLIASFRTSEKTSSASIKSFTRVYSNLFCFYKKEESGQKQKEFKDFIFQIKKKRRISHLLFLQKNLQQIIPDTKFFHDNWLLQKKPPLPLVLNSPLFTKQHKTVFQTYQTKKSRFQIVTPSTSVWISQPSLVKVEVEFETPHTFGKLENFKKNIFVPTNQDFKKPSYHHLFVPGLSLMFYRKVKFKNSNLFTFRTFQGGWVLPEFTVTRAFLKSKKLGEFRQLQTKQEGFSFSLLRNQDLITLMLPCKTSQSPISEVVDNTQFSQKIGKQVRWGQEFLPGFASSISGQIIKTTSTTLTLQKGIPLLASIRGLVHISHNDLIEKNDLLITLRSRRLQTEDIVQGIPKIEQLFEARETQGGEIIQNNMHMLLSNFFNRALQVKPVPEAVQLSLTYIQKFLVENILQAYSNQGVHIAEKHVEVVVRQMTARVRITHGGETGFLPGEFVQLRLIEKVNLKLALLGRREAEYEPVILGITKSVLQSESFLLAASFQQVSKVLVRSALSKKTDFLRGLHENILVGQPIPAGTGLIDLNHFIEKRAEALDDANSFGSSDFKSNSIQLN
jgi:hypothetical protein